MNKPGIQRDPTMGQTDPQKGLRPVPYFIELLIGVHKVVFINTSDSFAIPIGGERVTWGV